MPGKKPSAVLSRVPALMVAAGLAVFAFYFVFLRAGRGSSAEASASLVPLPGTTKTEPPAPAPTPPPAAPAPEPGPPPAPEPAAPEPPPAPAPARQEWQHDVAIDRLINDGQPLDARAKIAELFATDITDTMRAELAIKGVNVNQRLLVTNPEPRDVEISEIRQGESLIAFSRRFRQLHGEYGIIKLVNSIRNDGAIRAGLRLRVPRGTWSILVDKSLFTLYLCYEGAPFKTYRVCIGAKDNTPAARFTVGLKNPNPDWYAPPDWLEREKETNPVRHANPKNPLGAYWIGLDSDSFNGFGIHGTNEPHTIGTRASMGCVRMLNPEVVELARVVWKGMEVSIVE